jgi:hypothetical protein
MGKFSVLLATLVLVAFSDHAWAELAAGTTQPPPTPTPFVTNSRPPRRPWVISQSGFTSSLSVRDKGDRFELRASFRDADISSVKVTAENKNTLRLAIALEDGSKVSAPSDLDFSRYEQRVTFPRIARIEEMKVNRKKDEVVVTIPKRVSKQ